MARYPTLGGQALSDPGELYRWAQANGTPLDFWQRANSYRCPLGPSPGVCWVIMDRSRLDDLDKNDWHTLRWIDETRTLEIPSLSIVKSSTMSRSLPGAADAPRLVMLEDKRRQMGMSSINSQYNVRRPAPAATSGTDLYYTDSLDSGALWTWQTLLDDIWTNFPSSIRGTAPTLPYSPDGSPEGWRFIGRNAWQSLHRVLEKVGCITSYDPIGDSFSFVRMGTTQSGLSSSLASAADRRMYDYDPGEDYQLAHIPETVRVFFHRRETYHGIEKDTPDSSNWEMTPVVSKDYSTGITGAIAGSVQAVWDDLPALYDSTGSNTNSAALQTRADEIGANIANDFDHDPTRRMFDGVVLDILPGSEVSEVIWRDYGDSTGLVTEIIGRPRETEGRGRECTVSPAADAPAAPVYPLYPRTDQLVQVDDGSSPTGTELTANGDGLFPGYVLRWAGSAYEQLEACWIRPLDLDGSTEANIVDLKQKDRMVGRLYGNETSGGTTLPVYLCRKGHPDDSEGDMIRIVEVTGDDGAAFTDCSSDEVGQAALDCVYRARIVTQNPDTQDLCDRTDVTDGADVWLRVVQTPWCEEIDDRMVVGSRFLARKVSDSYTIGENDFPFYEACMEDTRLWCIRPQNAWTGTNNLLLYTPDGDTEAGIGADAFEDDFGLWDNVLGSVSPIGYGIAVGDKIFPIAMQRKAIEYSSDVTTAHLTASTTTQLLTNTTLVSGAPYIDGTAPTVALNTYRFAAPTGTQVRLKHDPNAGGAGYEIVDVARSEPMLLEIFGADLSGAAPQLDGTTSLCVWSASLQTPTSTAGTLCGSSNVCATVQSESVWFGFAGPAGAQQPYYLGAGGKRLAYDTGNNFLPTGLADNATNNRRLYLAELDVDTFWGKASENWTQYAGRYGDWVDVHPCDDRYGSNAETDISHRVFLPQVAERDPNIVTDDVIAYRLAMDGLWVCVSDYLDDKIGTVKMWALTEGGIPPGWAMMDGTANSIGNGGSGYSMANRFVRGSDAAGTSGGTDEHSHVAGILAHGSFESSDIAEQIMEHTHELAIWPHFYWDLEHEHAVVPDTITTGWDPDAGVPSQKSLKFCTGVPLVFQGDCLGDGWGPLEHYGSIGPAQYGDREIHPGGLVEFDVIVDYFHIHEASHVPKYTTLIFIERINNSI